MRKDESLSDYERKFYTDSLEKSTQGPASTGYGNPVNQRVRFNMFLETMAAWAAESQLQTNELRKFSLLDVGCGTGDLFDMMNMEGVPLTSYVGIDRDERMIEVARERFATVTVNGNPVDFEVGTALDEIVLDRPIDKFDVVTAIAAYALKPEDWDMRRSLAYVQKQIEALVDWSDDLVFVTLFSTWKNNVLPTEMNLDPAVMLNWALSKWDRVSLVHDYAPHDFALVIHKQPGMWWRNRG